VTTLENPFDRGHHLMGFFDSLKRAFSGSGAKSLSAPSAPAASRPEPAEIKVPEITTPALIAERRDGHAPLVLDCRENYERRQGYIPGSIHIVMREIPACLADLDRDADIVVVCAHGNRSYGVAGYLIENGFRARSLKGGTAGWQAQGGEIGHD
jgi:rhodanese-related sulfurtransferase